MTGKYLVALLLLGVGTLAGCNCDDAEGDIRTGKNPQLEVTPGNLSFAAGTELGQQTQSATIRNVGTGTLTSLRFAIDPPGTPFDFIDPGVSSLNEGSEAEIQVTYTPDDANPDSAILVITGSNNQRAEVLLNAETGNYDVQCVPPINFGPIEVGTMKTVTTRVENSGLVPLTVERISLEFADQVTILEEPQYPVTLQPLEGFDVTLEYDASVAGTLNDNLRVVIAESSDVFTCDVRGTTNLPIIDVVTQVDFGYVPLGETVTELVDVRNAGTSDLELSQVALTIDSDQDALAVVNPPAMDSPVVIEPGDVHQIELSYTAHDRTSTGTAVFFSNDPVLPTVNVQLLGRPSQPDIAVSPESVDFGTTGVDTMPRLSISVFNNGDQPLTVDPMTITGDAAFTVVANGAFPPTDGGSADIDGFGVVEVELQFQPTSPGNFGATLNIPSNDPDTPNVQVPLTGIAAEGGECRVMINPDPVMFGVVTRGNTEIIPVQVQNVGSGLCTYAGARAEGTFNAAFSVAGADRTRGDTFGPGESTMIDVQFFPTLGEIGDEPLQNNGLVEAVITDPSNGEATVYCGEGLYCQMNPMDPFRCVLATPPPCSAAVSGLSAPAALEVIPGELDFGLVTVGCASQANDVSIYNTGFEPVDITDIQLEGCTDEFALRATPPSYPVEVSGNTPLVVQVVYVPADADAGGDTCELVITSDTQYGTVEKRVPLSGEGTTLSHQTDTHIQEAGRKVDVLFVVDISGSMEQELDFVADELTSFFATAELLETDFHVGVTHLGYEDSVFAFGRQNEAGELVGNPPFLTPDTPNYVSSFAARVRFPNLGGGTPEAGLISAERAFTDPYGLETMEPCVSDADCSGTFSKCSANNRCGGRNVGFLRDEAALEIVIVSDEEDQSPQTPDFYLQFFQSLKGFRNDGLLHVSVIVGADPVTGMPAMCSSSTSSAGAGQRYDVVAQATGGTTGSICANSYAPYLAEIGNRAFGLRKEFFLSRIPDESTIEVTVDGTTVDPADYVYDPATNSIIFNDDAVPAEDSEITIDYEAFCFE